MDIEGLVVIIVKEGKFYFRVVPLMLETFSQFPGITSSVPTDVVVVHSALLWPEHLIQTA